jgi:HSP20 family molecular chaperone IbpA
LIKWITKGAGEIMKSKKWMNVIIILLGLICLSQAAMLYYVFKPEQSVFKNADDFSSFFHKKFKAENKNQWDRFDHFFNDDFFQNQNDPFGEMDIFHRNIEEMMEKTLRPSFRQSWDSWFDDRFFPYDDQINMQISETQDSYIVELTMPDGLQDNKLNVDITKENISIDGNFTKNIEKKDAEGKVIARNESRQSISQKFSIPENADFEKARIDQKADRIIITLPKIKPA